MDQSKMGKETSWQNFERQVGHVLTLAGYEVERDCLLAGGQTDILATKTIGPITNRLIIECKYSEINKSVGIDQVENFVARVITLRSDDLIDAGLLVTNSDFTKNAKAVTNKNYIELLTYEQLYSKIFDFRPYVSATITEFEKSKLYSTFVKPYMDEFNFEKDMVPKELMRSGAIPESSLGTDIINFCDEWLKSKDGARLCLLGDYGTGKTSFCKWYAVHRAKIWIKHPEENPIPLLIPLNRFTKAVDIDALVTDFLVNQCSIGDFRLSAFQFLLEQGRFLLLLDGFDEMARYVDREVRYQTITDVSKLARGKAKVILTGRPSYFPTDEELVEALAGSEQNDLYLAARNAYNELVDYDLYQIRPFSKRQIESFVSKFVTDKNEISQTLNFIKKYDLLDLASRPVLLEMVVKSLPKLLSMEKPGIINAAKLYKVYTGLWLDREYQKGHFRKLISNTDKLRFIEELAFQLYSEDRHNLSHTQLGVPIKKFFKIKDADFDYFSHDIRTCSFLYRIPRQGYSFAHRSFQEFFVASKLLYDAKIKRHESWSLRHLPPEILRFTAELAANEKSSVSDILQDWSEKTDDLILSKNALGVLLLAGYEVKESILHTYEMDQAVLHSYSAFRVSDAEASQVFTEFLFNRVSIYARRLALRIINVSKVDVDDLLGDTFFQASKRLQQQEIMTANELDRYLSTLMQSSISLLSRQVLRREKEVNVEPNFFVGIAAPYTDVETRIILNDLFEKCHQWLRPDERKLFEFILEDRTSEEMAEFLNISKISLLQKRRRLMTKIKKFIEDND
jgi:hypothetical protein